MDIDQIDNFLIPWDGQPSMTEAGLALGAVINSQSRSGADALAEFSLASGEEIETIRDFIAGKIYPTQRILDALDMHLCYAEYRRNKRANQIK